MSCGDSEGREVDGLALSETSVLKQRGEVSRPSPKLGTCVIEEIAICCDAHGNHGAARGQVRSIKEIAPKAKESRSRTCIERAKTPGAS